MQNREKTTQKHAKIAKIIQKSKKQKKQFF